MGRSGCLTLFARSTIIAALLLTSGGALVAEPPSPGKIIERLQIPSDVDPVLLPVSLNSKTMHFALDTGATASVFDSSLIGLLGQELRTQEHLTGDGVATMRFFESPDATIGKLRFRPANGVAVADLKTFREGTGEDIRGVVGMDFLRPYVMRIDFDHHEVVFLESPGNDAGTRVSLIYDDSSCPCVKARLTGVDTEEQFLVDLGLVGRTSGGLRTEIYTALQKAGQLRDFSSGHAASLLQPKVDRRGRLEEIVFAGESHKQLLFSEELQSRLASRLGLNYWARYVVTFDFPHAEIYLKRGQRYGTPDLEDMSGILFFKRDGKIVVTSVAPESPAAVAGIEVNDVIASVDGAKADTARLKPLRDALCVEGNSVKLVVRRAEKDREVTLRLKNWRH